MLTSLQATCKQLEGQEQRRSILDLKQRCLLAVVEPDPASPALWTGLRECTLAEIRQQPEAQVMCNRLYNSFVQAQRDAAAELSAVSARLG
jgi:hypothetical protein